MWAWSVLGCFAPLCVLGKMAGVVVGAAQGCPRVYRIGPRSGGMLGLVSQGPRFAEATGQPGCPDPASICLNRVEGNINSGTPQAL